MADVMSRLGVGARIYTGFAAILALLGVVGWVGYDGLGRAGAGVSDYAQVSNNTIFVVGMAGATQEMRRHVLNYAYTGSDKALKRVDELRGSIGQNLAEFETRTTNPPRKALGGDLRRLFTSYGIVLEQFFEVRRNRDQLVKEQMDPISRDLRLKYSEIMKAAMADGDAGDAAAVGETQELVMLARIQILRMLNDPDPKLAEEAQIRMTAAQRAVAGLPARENGPDRRKLAEEAQIRFAGFADAFAKVVSVNARFIRLIREDLPQIGDQFGQSIEALHLSQAGDNAAPDHFKGSQKATEQKTKDGVAAVQSTAVIIALAALGIGLLLAWLIARSITRPVVAMTGTMSRLAAGELSVDIPALGSRDEIGEMAKAVQVFKDNAIEKQRMADAERARLTAEHQAVEARHARESEIGGEIAALIAAVSRGDMTSRLALGDKDGFYRTISEGINRLTDTVQAVMTDLGQVLGALAEGDLDRRITKDYQGSFEQLKTDVNATSAKLGEIMHQITEATGAISTAAAEVSAGSADLSERTEQQASSLEQTAAAMEEVGATVRTSAENAQRANTMAADARGAAEQGGVVAGAAIEAMRHISESSRKITDIIGVIDEIAFQTNLLALNAAVEAARAGDAGKGFAVVAQEVRVLAQRSAQASKEIKTLILASDGQVRNGVEMVRKAGGSLTGIVHGVQQVALLISEMAVAASEQATALDEINAAVATMDEMTQKNAALVEETTAAAQAMTGQAHDLQRLVGFFRIGGGRGGAARGRRR